jgi:aspartyl protease family protein
MVRLLRLALGAITAIIAAVQVMISHQSFTSDSSAKAASIGAPRDPWAPSGAARDPWAPSGAARGSGESIALARDASGQFHLDGQVNGHDTRFLVDTGADTMALTMSEAEQAGIDVSALSFAPIIQTASGPGLGARVRIERLTLGGTELRDIDAVVVRDLPVNLLGQSVLRLGKVELSGDRMVIEPD